MCGNRYEMIEIYFTNSLREVEEAGTPEEEALKLQHCPSRQQVC